MIPDEMSLDCSITDIIRSDFNTLWSCSHRGNTVEVVTPYVLPDSNFLTLFFTEREGRVIACEGGRVWELIQESLGWADEEALEEVRAIAKERGLKEGDDDGSPIFFKDCRDPKLISSIAFDVANFAVVVTNVVLASFREMEDKTPRFVSDAREYMHQIIAKEQTLTPNAPVHGVPNVKFSAVISKKNQSRIWIVSCISGASLTDFRKNTSDAALNLNDAWNSSSSPYIVKTVPVLNDRAHGYDPDKLDHRLSELAEFSRIKPVLWSEREKLRDLLWSNGSDKVE